MSVVKTQFGQQVSPPCLWPMVRLSSKPVFWCLSIDDDMSPLLVRYLTLFEIHILVDFGAQSPFLLLLPEGCLIVSPRRVLSKGFFLATIFAVVLSTLQLTKLVFLSKDIYPIGRVNLTAKLYNVFFLFLRSWTTPFLFYFHRLFSSYI